MTLAMLPLIVRLLSTASMPLGWVKAMPPPKFAELSKMLTLSRVSTPVPVAYTAPPRSAVPSRSTLRLMVSVAPAFLRTTPPSLAVPPTTLPPITVTSFKVSDPPGRTSNVRSKSWPTMMVCSGLVPWMMIALVMSRSPVKLSSSSAVAAWPAEKTGLPSFCCNTRVSVPAPAVQFMYAVLVLAARIASRSLQPPTPSARTLMVAATATCVATRATRLAKATSVEDRFVFMVCFPSRRHRGAS